MYLIISGKERQSEQARRMVAEMRYFGARVEWAPGVIACVKRALVRGLGGADVVHVMDELSPIAKVALAWAVAILAPSARVVVSLCEKDIAWAGLFPKADQLIVGRQQDAQALERMGMGAIQLAPWVEQYHAGREGFLLDMFGLVYGEYVLVEKGARYAPIHGVSYIRLTGKETRTQKDTLYGGAMVVVCAKDETEAIGYGAVPVIATKRLVHEDVAHIAPGVPLPSRDELIAMRYFNRSLVADYLGAPVRAKALLTIYQRIEFFGEAFHELNVAQSDFSNE